MNKSKQKIFLPLIISLISACIIGFLISNIFIGEGTLYVIKVVVLTFILSVSLFVTLALGFNKIYSKTKNGKTLLIFQLCFLIFMLSICTISEDSIFFENKIIKIISLAIGILCFFIAIGSFVVPILFNSESKNNKHK